LAGVCKFLEIFELGLSQSFEQAHEQDF